MASSRRSPVRPVPRAPPEASARTATSRSSSRAIASSPPAGSARPAPPARATSDACWPSKAMALSDDLREELAAIAPSNECDRLAELSGLFHVAGRAHLRGRGRVDVHLDVSRSPAARRAFALLRACGVSSEIRTYSRRAFDRATRYQLHVEGSSDAYVTLHRAGGLDRSHRPLGRPPSRAVARRCCAAAYLRGA